MSENIGFTDSKDVKRVHFKKRRTSTPLFDLHEHVRVQILTHDSMSLNIISHCFA